MRAKNRRFAWILTLLLVFTCVFSLAIFTACRKDEKAALSVTSVEKTATEGNVDVYTMSFSDGSDFTFRITNGASGTDGVNGTNGANAYELYKKYNPDYAGSEETWLNDLVHGRLDSNYIENSTCLVTLTVKDGEGNPVKDVFAVDERRRHRGAADKRYVKGRHASRLAILFGIYRRAEKFGHRHRKQVNEKTPRKRGLFSMLGIAIRRYIRNHLPRRRAPFSVRHSRACRGGRTSPSCPLPRRAGCRC